jgi:hypothetical protein
MRMTKQNYRKISWILLGLAAAACISGCAQSDTPAGPPAAQPIGMTIKLCDTGAEGCAGSGNFSVTTIRDLGLSVEWKNVPAGTHSQQIALVQPNGVVYQTVSHGFSVPDGTIGSPSLEDVIPVAGTFITQRSLTGQWSVEISLDGATVGNQTFQIEP